MIKMETIVNKVAESGLITIDLQQFIISDATIEIFDIKDYLFKELLLKEKDFRAAMLQLDWSKYQDKYVAVICSSDAIIPMWAYMLIANYLQNVAIDFIFGDTALLKESVFIKQIESLNVDPYIDARIVVKGCGDNSINENGFLKITQKLKPVVRSLMYGEPCSTVPIYKRK